jgi:hypothetical protein
MAKPKGKSILTDTNDQRCFYTKVPTTEVHHVMNGSADRRKADADGLWIYVSRSAHNWLHSTPEGKKEMLRLKALAQKEYEKTHSHEQWMERYHKNYGDI